MLITGEHINNRRFSFSLNDPPLILCFLLLLYCVYTTQQGGSRAADTRVPPFLLFWQVDPYLVAPDDLLCASYQASSPSINVTFP